MTIRFFLKAFFLILLTSQSFAAARWDGFYVGANGGGTRGNINLQTWVAPGGTYFNYTTDSTQVDNAGNKNTAQNNFAGGLFGGYAHQFGNIVLGAEVSVNSLPLNYSYSVYQRFISDPNILYVVSQSLKANWQETLRLKLGFAHERWLAYLTGGTAFTSLNYKSSYSDDNAMPGSGLPGAAGSGSASWFQFGWTLGGGVEYALNDSWSVKAEYL